MKNCIICGKTFVAKRTTAQYCSDTCRMKAFRNGKDEVEAGETLKTTAVAGENPVTIAMKRLTELQTKQKEQDEAKAWMDEYFGSKQYSKDVAALAQTNPRSNYGGMTKDGYTKHTLPDGETVSIPVNLDTKR